MVQTCFYFPHHRHHIEVTNSLLCRNTQYYGCTRCVVNELAQRPNFSFEAATLSLAGIRPRDHSIVSRVH